MRVGKTFSPAEYDRRYAAVRRVASERGLDAVVCYAARGAPGLVEYLAGFAARHEAYLIVPSDPALPATLFVQLFNHVPNARQIAVVPDTRWGGPDSAQAVAGQLKELGLAAGRLGYAGLLPQQRFAALGRALSEASWTDLTGPLGRLRWVKSEEELACLRAAAALTDKAVEALVRELRPGLRDCELPAIMQAAVAAEGGQIDLCFLASTPMADPRVCVPAQNLSARTIERGDVIITEIGVARDGYAGQIHRPIAVGERPNSAYQALYAVALETYHAVAGAIRPGASAEEALDAAEVVAARGYSICDDLVHGFGGGYLPPVLRTRQTMAGPAEPFVFERNMCIVVQPNIISRDERMGLQLGQLHVVGEAGLEPLHSYPLEFIVV